ncbi:unnamed protein product, partial [marine sediment metagenome]
LDAMPGGGRLEVSVRREDGACAADASLRRDAPRVIVEFTDHGEGMTEEVRAQLFHPFFTTRPRGTGLGLSIVRRIVEGHEGHIEVESAPGRGSTFRVVLKGCPTAKNGSRKPDAGIHKKEELPLVGVSTFRSVGTSHV